MRFVQSLYGSYFRALFGLLGSATYIAALLPLQPQAMWSFAQRTTRLFFRLARIPVCVQIEPGPELPQAGSGQLLVANHASDLDAVLLIATLPHFCRLVVSRELARVPLVGRVLRRLGSVFVDAFDGCANLSDVRGMADLAIRGETCIAFPEGPVGREAGLRPFHLAAFAAAVRADRAVVPVGLQGTRALLPDLRLLPRRMPVVVHIGRPVLPLRARSTFETATQMRDTARRAILEHCGEIDLTASATDSKSTCPAPGSPLDRAASPL